MRSFTITFFGGSYWNVTTIASHQGTTKDHHTANGHQRNITGYKCKTMGS
jgi:hypothetical protein